MKLAADKNRTEYVFQVGEEVLLKLQPYAQSSLVNHPCPKLAMKYFGPYTVLECIGSGARNWIYHLPVLYTLLFMCPSRNHLCQIILQYSLNFQLW